MKISLLDHWLRNVAPWTRYCFSQFFIVYYGQPHCFFCGFDASDFYLVFVTREKLSSHFWMQFWTRLFVVLLPCWQLVAVGNQLLLVYQLLELLLWGNMLFRDTYRFLSDRYSNLFLGSHWKMIFVGIQISL